MTKAFFRMIMPVIGLFVFLSILHITLAGTVLPEVYKQSKYWLLYVFMVPVTLTALLLIRRMYLKNPKSVGKGFFAYVIIKMILVIAFLSPWLFYKDEFTRPFVYQFLLIFFPILFLETLILVRLVNGKYEEG